MITKDILEAVGHAEQQAERFGTPFALIDVGDDKVQVLPFDDDRVTVDSMIELVRPTDEPD